MKYIFPLVVLLFFSCEGNGKKETSTTIEKPAIAVVNYPLYYFAKTIGGNHVNVYLPSIGGDPVYWQPDSRQVNNFQKADIILANGAGYAKWMEKVSLPSSKIVITSDSFRDQWIEIEEGVTHSHGPEGEHVHKGTAFTTWLNFEFAALQAEEVYTSLIKILPDKEPEFKTNYDRLQGELTSLDAKMKNLAAQISEEHIITSHPVYQYMENAYGLHITSLHWEPDEMPGDEEWKEVKHLVVDHKAKIMIYENEPLPEIKTKLQEIGIRLVVFNPSGNRPETGNFVEVMKENLENLLSAKTSS